MSGRRIVLNTYMIASHDPRLARFTTGFGDEAWVAAHAESVRERCCAMALVLGFDRRRRERLALAASLHDVGKLMLSSAIVNKPGRLDDAELAVMRRHPVLGAEALANAGLHEAARIVRHHHERVDGKGYPDGLRGDEIPLEARVIHVADAFDAMTSDRPYARARGEDEALVEVVRHVGTQFDRRCVAAFVATLPVPAEELYARTSAIRSSRPSIVAGSPRPLPS